MGRASRVWACRRSAPFRCGSRMAICLSTGVRSVLVRCRNAVVACLRSCLVEAGAGDIDNPGEEKCCQLTAYAAEAVRAARTSAAVIVVTRRDIGLLRKGREAHRMQYRFVRCHAFSTYRRRSSPRRRTRRSRSGPRSSCATTPAARRTSRRSWAFRRTSSATARAGRSRSSLGSARTTRRTSMRPGTTTRRSAASVRRRSTSCRSTGSSGPAWCSTSAPRRTATR